MSGSKLSVKPYRGTRDFYPEDMKVRQHVFNTMRSTARSFGYEEYDGPMLESFDLYAAKSGEELVNEQLYHFEDRGKRHVAIRPEMTPTVARMVAARINQLQTPVRWFSFPNLWRYEKPQRGRLREHWQFNVDILGTDSICADQEIIEVAIGVMQGLGARSGQFKIHIANRRVLTYFLENVLKIPETNWGNVCRAVDKRAKISSDAFRELLIENKLTSTQIDELNGYMNLTISDIQTHAVSGSDGSNELQTLFEGLEKAGLSQLCTLDMSIVRGLDYYTGTVFEMFDEAPENKRALFGGGRYDNLVGLFTKQRVSGIGFGMGDVTIRDFLDSHNLLPDLPPSVQAHVGLFDASLTSQVSALGRELRQSGFRTTVQLDPAKLGKQFKWADAKGIPIVVMIGPDEIENNQVTIKHLPTRQQMTVDRDSMTQVIKSLLD